MNDLTANEVATARKPTQMRRSGLGVRLTLRTIVCLYVSVLVLVPLVLVTWRALHPGVSKFMAALTNTDSVHAFQLTAIVALIAVAINTVFGVGVSLLLARYDFFGRRLLSAFIDLPISISPIVVGLALLLVYGPQGWLAVPLKATGVDVVGAIPGMVLATVFVSLPLIVREVVPVLNEAGIEQEQAAQCLGAGAATTFRRITLPTIKWALAYGVVLSLARSLGEYGAVLVISGNVIGQTETATLRIDNLYQLSQETDAAYAITFVLVLVAVLAIVAITLIHPKQAEE